MCVCLCVWVRLWSSRDGPRDCRLLCCWWGGLGVCVCVCVCLGVCVYLRGGRQKQVTDLLSLCCECLVGEVCQAEPVVCFHRPCRKHL